MSTTPIRVLQIMGIVESGGVEAVIMNYYRHIDKSKIQFDFVMHKSSNENYINEVKNMGAKVYEVTPYTKNIIKFTYEIYKIIKEGKYQIVHSNMNALSGFSLMAAYLAGSKVRILHNHTTDSKEERLRTLIKRVLRPFAKVFANQHWACSKLAGEWMYGSKAVNSRKVTIINNAIDLNKFAFNQEKRDELRKELGLEGKFVVGHVGRFMKQKNHSYLIDIFARVKKQKENAILLLIGDGPLLESIKEKVNKLDITEQVIFLGARNDVADLYNAMDVFVLPSLYEGLPVVGVEAQANGLNFICSNNVTKEIVLSSAVKVLDINETHSVWAKEIIAFSKTKRTVVKSELTNKGFDITTEAELLCRKYIFMEKS